MEFETFAKNSISPLTGVVDSVSFPQGGILSKLMRAHITRALPKIIPELQKCSAHTRSRNAKMINLGRAACAMQKKLICLRRATSEWVGVRCLMAVDFLQLLYLSSSDLHFSYLVTTPRGDGEEQVSASSNSHHRQLSESTHTHTHCIYGFSRRDVGDAHAYRISLRSRGFTAASCYFCCGFLLF